MMTFSKQSEGVPMQTINLKQYYPFCKEDIFVEVSDEIVEAFLPVSYTHLDVYKRQAYHQLLPYQ